MDERTLREHMDWMLEYYAAPPTDESRAAGAARVREFWQGIHEVDTDISLITEFVGMAEQHGRESDIPDVRGRLGDFAENLRVVREDRRTQLFLAAHAENENNPDYANAVEAAQASIKALRRRQVEIERQRDHLLSGMEPGADRAALEESFNKRFTATRQAIRRARHEITAAEDLLLDPLGDLDRKEQEMVVSPFILMRDGAFGALSDGLSAGTYDVNQSDGKQTLLHYAVWLQDFPVVDLLVRDFGADVNARDASNATPLIDCESSQIFSYLVDHGADIHAADKFGKTPLMNCCERGDGTSVAQLLRLGADPNAQTVDGRTAVRFAIQGDISQYRMTDILSDLAQAGANLELCDREGYTPLEWAVRNNKKDAVQALIMAGCEVNPPLNANGYVSKTTSPLIEAARAGNNEMTAMLLEAGADPNRAVFDGHTPLIEACRHGRKEVVDTLLEHGANVRATNIDFETPLLAANQVRDTSIIDTLIDHGADLYFTDTDLQNILHCAAWSGNVELVNYLIDRDFDLNLADNCEYTALAGILDLPKDELYPGSDYEKIFNSLLAAGADVNIGKTGGSPLELGIANLHTKYVDILLEHGADCNLIVDPDRTTLLMDTMLHYGRADDETAPEYKHIIKSMLAAGADVDRANRDGYSPLSMARNWPVDKRPLGELADMIEHAHVQAINNLPPEDRFETIMRESGLAEDERGRLFSLQYDENNERVIGVHVHDPALPEADHVLHFEEDFLAMTSGPDNDRAVFNYAIEVALEAAFPPPDPEPPHPPAYRDDPAMFMTPKEELAAALKRNGLIEHQVRMDGTPQQVPVEGSQIGSLDGLYMCSEEGVGFIRNALRGTHEEFRVTHQVLNDYGLEQLRLQQAETLELLQEHADRPHIVTVERQESLVVEQPVNVKPSGFER